jgi:hypothetical protein
MPGWLVLFKIAPTVLNRIVGTVRLPEETQKGESSSNTAQLLQPRPQNHPLHFPPIEARSSVDKQWLQNSLTDNSIMSQARFIPE